MRTNRTAVFSIAVYRASLPVCLAFTADSKSAATQTFRHARTTDCQEKSSLASHHAASSAFVPLNKLRKRMQSVNLKHSTGLTQSH